MSRKNNLINRASKTAYRRKRIFGIDPPPGVALLLERKPSALKIREAVRLFFYILFKSPRHRLNLFWRHLTDRDTPLKGLWIDRMAQELRSLLSEESTVSCCFFERRNYGRDLARVPSFLATALFRTTPHLAVQPREEGDIVKTLGFSRLRGLPVIPRGAASSAFGGVVPTRSGIVIDLSPMMAVLDVDAAKKTVKVQPGARWADVSARLESQGLALKTTPTSRFSTVGGWISTGGMGLGSYGFGSVFQSVDRIRVVRPDGSTEELDAGSDSIKDFFGTEGQFGILTEITLCVRPKPEYSKAHLLTFDSPEKAFDFIEKINTNKNDPSHVVFFDQEYMRRENILFKEKNKKQDPIVAESDSVLLHFETQEGEQEFLSSLNGTENQSEARRLAASYLWSDRYFPLKAQRIGPGLLGTEVVFPGKGVPEYIAGIRKLARRFGIRPSIEVIVCKGSESSSYLVIVSFVCDFTRAVHYLLNLLFNQLLVRMAGRWGGHPYGTGIWNTPFIHRKYNPEELRRLKEVKRKRDPNQTLNPNKFFKVKGRFFSIPALVLRPSVFRPFLTAAHFFSPVLGQIASLAKPKRHLLWDLPHLQETGGKSLLLQCARRCTSCGSCVSVCPAYHIAKDELVTGRSKLRMAEAIAKGEALSEFEAHRPFQCLQCGLCEEVCQTHLPLRDGYLVLEEWLETRFGSPKETVQRFIEELDKNRRFIENIFGLDLPEWSPDELPIRVPQAQRISEGREA